MNICLIGFGIPSLILANILAKKNIKISIFDEGKTKNNSSSRTIGITKNNIDYLKKEKIIIRNKAWKINNIKIFNESLNQKELLSFGPENDKLFSVVKNSDLTNLLRRIVKKIANNQYRLYAGPFKNINTLKSTYISLNKLGFDDLNIIRIITEIKLNQNKNSN